MTTESPYNCKKCGTYIFHQYGCRCQPFHVSLCWKGEPDNPDGTLIHAEDAEDAAKKYHEHENGDEFVRGIEVIVWDSAGKITRWTCVAEETVVYRAREQEKP